MRSYFCLDHWRAVFAAPVLSALMALGSPGCDSSKQTDPFDDDGAGGAGGGANEQAGREGSSEGSNDTDGVAGAGGERSSEFGGTGGSDEGQMGGAGGSQTGGSGGAPATGGTSGSSAPSDGCDARPPGADHPKLKGLCYKKVWDGEGSGWLVPDFVKRAEKLSTSVVVLEDVNSPPLAQKFEAKFDGLNEFGIQGFPTVRDLGRAQYFVLWVKLVGAIPLLRVDWGESGNTACGRLGYAWPDRLGVNLRNYNPNWNNGQWQQVIIPAKDIHQNKSACMSTNNIAFRIDGGPQNFVLIVDDIGFYFPK